MSKNVVIQEGGVGRQFTANKLTTALIGGGSCNWVPEDEIQLGTKSITENGTYVAANDGEYGYSQVTVNVSSAEKIITGTTNDGTPAVATIDVVDGNVSQIILGDYFIVTYDEDGKVAKIEDNNGNVCTLIYDGETLSGFNDIEDNHYTIILDSNGNISQVIDPNAQDCELRDSDGDGKIDIISIGAVMQVIPDVETGDIKIIDENDNDVTDDFIGTSITGVDSDDTPWRANITDSTSGDGASMGITPVTPATTPGASILGTNEDGEKVKGYIDENGKLVEEIMPSSIGVLNMPRRTMYYDGQTIDYTGLVVQAYLKNGEIWNHETYPNGIIPFEELTLSVTQASSSESSEVVVPAGTIYVGSDSFVGPITGIIVEHVYSPNGRHYDYASALNNSYAVDTSQSIAYANRLLNDGDRCICTVIDIDSSMPRLLYASDFPFGGISNQGIYNNLNDNNYTAGASSISITTYTYDGDTVYYTSIPLYAPKETLIIEPSSESYTKAAIIAWYLWFGENMHHGQQEIPVQWECPLDFQTYETSFNIDVEENPYDDEEGNE